MIPNLDQFPPVIEHTKPQMKGEGKYPIKLQDRLASEIATVLCLTSTVFNIIPVTIGTMKPPKKSKSQMRVAKSIKSFIKGTGRAQATASIPAALVILIALGDE